MAPTRPAPDTTDSDGPDTTRTGPPLPELDVGIWGLMDDPSGQVEAATGNDEATIAPVSGTGRPRRRGWRGAPSGTAGAAAPAPAASDSQPGSSDTIAIPEPATRKDTVEHGAGKQRRNRKATKPARTKPDREPAGPVLHVPRPGGKLRGARRGGIALKVVTLFTGASVIASGAGLAGFLIAAALSSRTVDISAESAARWHLDEYNVEAAAAFGSRYLDVCLTRYSDRDKETVRRNDATNYSAASVDPACAPSNPGEVKGRSVTSIRYAGSSDSDDGSADIRLLSFDVSTTDNAPQRFVVPVYLTDPATGVGPRIVGNMGVLPVPRLGAPSSSPTTAVTDSTLATDMQRDFLPEFFAAWAASSDALTQFLAPSATAAATTGLNGTSGTPEVSGAVAIPPATAVDSSGATHYSDGMQVVIQTTVQFTKDEVTTGAAYRVTVQRAGTHWFVVDVAGGVVAVPQNARPAPTYSPAPSTTPTNP